jgi:hypothetical protein
MTAPLPVASPLSGVLWSWVVPILLFGTAFVATWLLYRHFAGPDASDAADDPDARDDER